MRDPDRQGYRYGSNPRHPLERERSKARGLLFLTIAVLFVATTYAIWP